MSPEVGRVYARKRNAKAEVVRAVAVVGEWVEFRYLHGSNRAMRLGVGRCKVKNFAAAGWELTAERDDYSDLDGATLFSTYLVQDTGGNPILRCSEKRARFYLRKGYVREVASGVLQFTDRQTEDRLAGLYAGKFSEFFLAVKNDRCVCCGATADLTRHHVVPKRHKATLPRPWRSCLSNVLFVCGTCHRRYEGAVEPDLATADDWQAYARAWRDHFIQVMSPQFLPLGWDIVSVQNFPAVEDLNRQLEAR